MADQVLTKQKLINADEDLGDLEEVLNGPPGKLIKTRLGREVYTLASVPQINTMTREEVTAAVAPKANKVDVDAALSDLSTTANKFYPTLAEANYYITTMAVNDVVTIGEEANKGLWYKATANATTLTKSDYDPLTQAKKYTDEVGEASIAGNLLSNINYVTSTRTLEFKNTIYVTTPNNVTALSTPQSVSLPNNTPYRLEYDVATGLIGAVAYNAARTQGKLNVGTATSSITNMSTVDFGFTIDGVLRIPPQNGELLTDIETRIAFNTIASTLTINPSVRVESPLYTASDRPSAVTVSIPTSNGIYRLQYDIKAGTFSFVSSASKQPDNTIDLATLYVSASGLKITGITNYTVDGVPSNKAIGVKTGSLIAVIKSDINFDFANKRILIAANKVRAICNNEIPDLLPAHTIDISGDETFLKRLMYNIKTKAFRAVRGNVATSDLEVQVATFCVSTKFVSGVAYYSVNGAESSGQKDEITTANFTVPYGELDADYTQPALPAYTSMLSSTWGDFTKMYALYDALMAQDPTHITKTVLGVDGLGNQLIQYQFNAPEVPTVSTTTPKKPKIIILSGVHGNEQTGVFNTFSAMKQIVERWKDDPRLEALYWGVNFIVVPVCNPTGFNASIRYNHNNVDIARNFTADWSAAQPNSGGSPMSQAETVIIDAVMSNNKDAIYCFSHHNFHAATNEGGAGVFIWNASATAFGRDLAKMLIIGQTVRGKKAYPAVMPQTNDYYIGYADNAVPAGSEGVQATKIYGIQAGTFEISYRFFWEDGTPQNSEIVATIGTETLINWLLLNVKYACELYNSRVNL